MSTILCNNKDYFNNKKKELRHWNLRSLGEDNFNSRWFFMSDISLRPPNLG